MTEETSLVALERTRAQGRERLGRAYANDVIDADELDRRLEALEQATDGAEIDRLLDDLGDASPDAPTPALGFGPVPPPPTAMVVAPAAITAWFSENARTGIWTPAWHTEVKARFASVKLDFREARLAPGTTTFVVDVLMGELELIVPPGLAIDVECSTFFGEVERDDHRTAPTASSAVGVRVVGRVWFGTVTIHEMLVGETKSDARKRRKRERKLRAEQDRRALRS